MTNRCFLSLGARSCNSTTLAALNKTLNWIESYHLDQQYGEMYWQVEVPSGQVGVPVEVK